LKKAKQMLTDPDKKDFTVLEILYDVGFNSKSSFITAFKKHTGYTPTEYRKKQLFISCLKNLLIKITLGYGYFE
jgi:AraC-like DNA-binding protein